MPATAVTATVLPTATGPIRYGLTAGRRAVTPHTFLMAVLIAGLMLAKTTVLAIPTMRACVVAVAAEVPTARFVITTPTVLAPMRCAIRFLARPTTELVLVAIQQGLTNQILLAIRLIERPPTLGRAAIALVLPIVAPARRPTAIKVTGGPMEPVLSNEVDTGLIVLELTLAPSTRSLLETKRLLTDLTTPSSWPSLGPWDDGATPCSRPTNGLRRRPIIQERMIRPLPMTRQMAVSPTAIEARLMVGVLGPRRRLTTRPLR